MLTLQIILFCVGAFVTGILMYMPVMRGDEAFFGVRVPDGFTWGEGRNILKGYWFWCAMTFISTQLIGFVTWWNGSWPTGAIVLPHFLLLAAISALYQLYYRRVTPYAMAATESRFAASLRVWRLGDFTNFPLELLICLLILLPIVTLVYLYPELPPKIPVHWGFNGEPDRWAGKGLRTVFAIPVLSIYLQVLLLLIKVGILRSKMTLPAQNTATFLRLKEEFLQASLRLIDLVRVPAAVMLGLVTLLLPVSCLPRLAFFQVPLQVSLWLTIFCQIGLTLFGLRKMWLVNGELRRQTGHTYVQTPEDAAHWRFGGLIYHNPDDPALMVEKLTGLGYTLNTGHKLVWLYLAYLLLLPILLLIFTAEL